jgi:hypothetical protein
MGGGPVRSWAHQEKKRLTRIESLCSNGRLRSREKKLRFLFQRSLRPALHRPPIWRRSWKTVVKSEVPPLEAALEARMRPADRYSRRPACRPDEGLDCALRERDIIPPLANRAPLYRVHFENLAGLDLEPCPGPWTVHGRDRSPRRRRFLRREGDCAWP